MIDVFSPPWRAYAIRPYTFSLKYFGKWELVGALRRHDGRMRYAPTHFRELFCEMEMVGASFPAMEGVCDTPLHIFANCFVKRELFGLIRCRDGRMRYAPTPFR